MTRIANARNYDSATCTTIVDTVVNPALWQTLFTFPSTEFPSAPNGSRDFLLAITGKVGNVRSFSHFSGLASIEVGLFDTNGSDLTSAYIHRLSVNSITQSTPDKCHPFAWIVRQADLAALVGLVIKARIALYGASNIPPAPTFELMDCTFSVFDEGALGADRIVRETDATLKVINSDDPSGAVVLGLKAKLTAAIPLPATLTGFISGAQFQLLIAGAPGAIALSVVRLDSITPIDNELLTGGAPNTINFASLGSSGGTASQLFKTVTPLPYGLTFVAGVIALTSGETIQDHPSAPTKTARVSFSTTAGAKWIQVDTLTGAAWGIGNLVYRTTGGALLGTIASVTDRWLILPSVRYRPRSWDRVVSLWWAQLNTNNFSVPSNPWGQDNHGGMSRGVVDPDPSGSFAGLYRNEYFHGLWNIVDVTTATTTIGLFGLCRYYAPLRPGQSAAQYVRSDIVCLRVTGLPFYDLLRNDVIGRWYTRNGVAADGEFTRDVQMAEARNGLVFLSGAPMPNTNQAGRSYASRFIFNDGTLEPRGIKIGYVAEWTSSGGYDEGLPDLTHCKVPLVEGLNTFRCVGYENPSDPVATGPYPAHKLIFALVPDDDTPLIYPAEVAPISGPTVQIHVNREIELANLPKLPIQPSFPFSTEFVTGDIEIVTINGYVLSRPKFLKPRRRHRGVTWLGLTVADRNELLTFWKGPGMKGFAMRFSEDTPWRFVLLDGRTLIEKHIEAQVYTLTADLIEAIWV